VAHAEDVVRLAVRMGDELELSAEELDMVSPTGSATSLAPHLAWSIDGWMRERAGRASAGELSQR
jgi:hypothetical protein